jgi:hypothetical protein
MLSSFTAPVPQPLQLRSQDANPRIVTSTSAGSSVSIPIPDSTGPTTFCLGANPIVSNGSVATAPT